MLYDRVMASDELRLMMGKEHDRFKRFMLNAQRFELTSSFAAATDEITSRNPKGWRTTGHMMRLPYPICWLETVAKHRRSLDYDILPPGMVLTGRIGVLLTNFSDAQGTAVYLFWDTPSHGHRVSMSLLGLGWDFSPEGAGRIKFEAAAVKAWGKYAEVMERDGLDGFCIIPAWNDFFDWDVVNKIPDIETRKKQSPDDWMGEPWFWATALMLLNSRNVATVERLPSGGRHKMLRRQGLVPSDTFHVCKLHPRLRQWVGRESSRGHIGAVRSHFVRGHFKVRRSGVYWWSPYVRGNPELGRVEKVYEVA